MHRLLGTSGLRTMPINLKRLTPKQLDELARQLKTHTAERRSEKIVVLRAKAAEMARAAGLTLADVFPVTRARRRGTIAPKYRNPADPSQVWSGRGRQPRWFKAALRKGKTERALLIR
jgi:DNA-binding protein H-NS